MLKGLPRNVVILGIVSALNDMASEITGLVWQAFGSKAAFVCGGGIAVTGTVMLFTVRGLSDKSSKPDAAAESP